MADISKIKLPTGTIYDIKDATARTALANKLNVSLKGAASGLAELDSSGKVPSSQLPSYVDDVLDYTKKANFPSTGETGKIYVDNTTNKTYRWSGSAYVEISASLALGETSSTAYAGNKGKAATIEDDVYIAPSVCLVEDVVIGRGSVVGAGSVVTEDVPPQSIVVGVPAKIIKRYNPVSQQWEKV